MSRLSTMSRFAEPDLPPKEECVKCRGFAYIDTMEYIEGEYYCGFCAVEERRQ